MKKTRKQLNREREQLLFIIAVSVWILTVTAVIIYKAVTG